MKFTTLTVSALLLLTASDAFQPAVTKSSSRISQLDMAAKGNDSSSSSMWGPVATAVAGWTLAGQVAMAASTGGMVAPSDTQQDFGVLKESPTVLTAAFGAPSTGGGKSFDTMDFSMPSYDEGTGGGKAAAAAPSFNPFGDFQPEVVSGGDNQAAVNEDKAAAEAAKAEEKAAAAARKEEDKAAAASRKADEKAAAEADKAEKASADAAKKAEKAAKRQEELEKQRAAVERQKDAAAAAATSAPAAVEELKAPDVPAFKAPEFKAPDMPAFKMPEFKAPEFSAPSGDGSSAVKIPEFKAPDIKIPEFKAPDIPKFAMPKFDMPSAPTSSGDGYDLDTPKSAAPKVSTPSFSMPSVSAPPKEDATPLEPQEVRDDRAREARKVYLAADVAAKEAEAAAKLVRDAANQSAKLASAAKDEACETKPGGKLICLRNPFSSGF